MRAVIFVMMLSLLVGCGQSPSGSGMQSDSGVLDKPAFKRNDPDNLPPVVDGAWPEKVNVGETFTFIPDVYDPDGDKVRLQIDNLPGWLKMSPKDMSITGTPSLSDIGQYNNIMLNLTDGFHTSSIGPLSLLVVSVNTAPDLSGLPPGSIKEGESYYYRAEAIDAESDSLEFSLQNRPEWLSFDTRSGELAGVPGFADAGVYENMILSVSDGQETTSIGPFSIEVQNVNQPPVIVSEPQTSIKEGDSYRYVIQVSEPDGEACVVLVQNIPGWMIYDDTTRTLSGVPGYDTAGIYQGISIAVSDAGGSSVTQNFDLSVSNNNRSPVAVNMQVDAVEDAVTEIILSATDPDGDILQFNVDQNTLHGKVSLTGNILSYMPNPDYYGNDELRYYVTDVYGAQADASIVLNVQEVDDIPVAVDDSIQTRQDIPVQIDALVNDRGLGDQVVMSISGTPANGVVTMESPDKLVYTPAASFTGEDIFTYQLTDSDLDVASANVIVNVSASCDPNCSKLVQLSWVPVNDTEVSGYYVYHGVEPGQYTDRIWAGNVSQLDYEISQSGTHYFVATSANLQGTESDYSNEAQTLLQ